MAKQELPKSYSDKYDTDTVGNLDALLESIDHVVHTLNGVKQDILDGVYDYDKAQLDYETIVYLDGIDVFSALEEVANSPWEESRHSGASA